MRTRLHLTFFFIVGLLSSSAGAFPVQVTKHGPNCWNAALVYGRVVEALRYMSGRELHEVLRSGVCSPVPETHLRGGEIRVYSLPLSRLAEKDRYIHANLRLDEERSLNKMTNLLTSRIQVENEAVVQATYGRVAEIVTWQDRDGVSFQCRGTECETRIEYFRCGSLEKKLREADSPLYESFREVSLGLQGFVLLPPETEDADITVLKNRLARTTARFAEELSSRCATSAFPCPYYREALQSFREQLKANQPRREWLQEWIRSR